MRRSSTFTVLVLVLCSTAWGAEHPVAVSPGDTSKLALIGDTCPTFSWTEVPAAGHYELVIYEVGEAEGESTKLLRQSVPGGATNWTPSLDLCLERGGQYAWSVRAAGGEEASDWSAPNLFEVAAGPSEVEFEEAVQVVRQYLKDADTGVLVGHGTLASSTVQKAGSSSSAPQVVDPPAQLGGVAGDPALQVNGSSVVTVATFGAGLCEALTYRYVDLGDGTVLDCNTGLIWLKDASCFSALQWTIAVLSVDTLADPGCGLTDGSIATEWRLPTIGEFCSLGQVSGICPSANAGNSLVNTNFTNPTVGNAAGNGQWTIEDAFVKVFTNFGYWSATEFGAALAWTVDLNTGFVSPALKEASPLVNHWVWPVRGRQ